MSRGARRRRERILSAIIDAEGWGEGAARDALHDLLSPVAPSEVEKLLGDTGMQATAEEQMVRTVLRRLHPRLRATAEEEAHIGGRFEPLPHQIPPEVRDPSLAGRWDFWIILGGRGSGKTRPCVEYGMEHLREHGEAARWGVGGPTMGLTRDTCFEGESGIMTLYGHEFRKYNRQSLEAWHRSGAFVKGYGAEAPANWNGPQWTLLWTDELALWREESFEQAQFGLRLGAWPRTIVSTTPKQRKFVRALVEGGELVHEESEDRRRHQVRVIAPPAPEDGGPVLDDLGEPEELVVVTDTATTYDNPHLPRKRLSYFRVRYEGTRLGRQELHAHFLDEAEGAFWTLDGIHRNREMGDLDWWLRQMEAIAIGVDPSGGDEKGNDEVGIVAVGWRRDEGTNLPHYYTLRDESGRFSPDEWGRRAVRLYYSLGAVAIVGEQNYGGDMVKHVVRTVDPNVRYRKVYASRGKARRFEPIAALAEQGRDHHVGVLEKLEDEMVTWDPDDPDFSPNRVDGKAWATEYFRRKLERADVPDEALLPGSHSYGNVA